MRTTLQTLSSLRQTNKECQQRRLAKLSVSVFHQPTRAAESTVQRPQEASHTPL